MSKEKKSNKEVKKPKKDADKKKDKKNTNISNNPGWLALYRETQIPDLLKDTFGE